MCMKYIFQFSLSLSLFFYFSSSFNYINNNNNNKNRLYFISIFKKSINSQSISINQINRSDKQQIYSLVFVLLSCLLIILSLFSDNWAGTNTRRRGLWRECTLASSIPSLAYSLRSIYSNSFFICVPIKNACKFYLMTKNRKRKS